MHTQAPLRFERTDSTAHPDYPAAWTLYQTAFPACERRTEPRHLEALEDSTFFAYYIYSNEQFAGILYFWQWDNCSYLEHLATLPELRGRNIGGDALELWKADQAGRTLLLEIEPPADELTMRREGFYKRHGFVSNPYYYLHPSYGVTTEPHELVVMSFPTQIDQNQFSNFVDHSKNHIIKR